MVRRTESKAAEDARLARENAERSEFGARQSSLNLGRGIDSLREELRQLVVQKEALEAASRQDQRGIDGSLLMRGRCGSSHDEDMSKLEVVQVNLDELQDGESARREIARLRRELSNSETRVAAARTEYTSSQDTVTGTKRRLLDQLVRLDHHTTAFENGDIEESTWKDKWPVKKPWEVRIFSSELREYLSASEKTFVEIECLREKVGSLDGQHERLCDELNHEERSIAQLSSELRSVHDQTEHQQELGQIRLRGLQRELESQTMATKAAEAEMEASKINFDTTVSMYRSERNVQQSQLFALEAEAKDLASHVVREENELLRAAVHLPPRDTLLEEMQQRDAEAWSLNSRLAGACEDEVAASDQLRAQAGLEEALQSEVRQEASAVAGIRQQIKDLHSETSRKLMEQRRNSAGDKGTSFGAEVASLEAELHARAHGESHEEHSAIVAHLEQTRAELQAEKAQWRNELAQAREATYVQSAREPPSQVAHEQAVIPNSSGFRRAMRAWESVFGDEPSSQPEAGQMEFPCGRHGESERALDLAGICSGGRTTTPAAAGPSSSVHSSRTSVSNADVANVASAAPPLASSAAMLGNSRQQRQMAMAQALDAVDSLMEGRVTREQVDSQLARLASTEERAIAALAAAQVPPEDAHTPSLASAPPARRAAARLARANLALPPSSANESLHLTVPAAFSAEASRAAAAAATMPADAADVDYPQRRRAARAAGQRQPAP